MSSVKHVCASQALRVRNPDGYLQQKQLAQLVLKLCIRLRELEDSLLDALTQAGAEQLVESDEMARRLEALKEEAHTIVSKTAETNTVKSTFLKDADTYVALAEFCGRAYLGLTHLRVGFSFAFNV